MNTAPRNASLSARLARRAPVGAAAGEAHLGDGVRAAGAAGLAVAVVDGEVLEVLAGVAEGVPEPLGVEGGAVIRDPGADHLLDRHGEAGDLRIGQGAGRGGGVDAGAVEGFVRVDIAEAGDACLIEQRRFDGQSWGGAEGAADGGRVERGIPWVAGEAAPTPARG